MSPLLTFILGGPGSGKGTQCAKLLERIARCRPALNVLHLSAGALLREASRIPPPGFTPVELKEIHIAVTKGGIVRGEITARLLAGAIRQKQPHLALVDGFPRNEDNFAAYDNCLEMPRCGLVIVLDVHDERNLRERLQHRGRFDDCDAAAVNKRLEVFRAETIPLVEQLKKSDLFPVVHVDASSSIENVHERVWSVVKSYLS